eukprot:187227-Prorocentrum_minimum.AAC.2
MALGVVVPHEQRVDPGEHPPRRLARIVVKSGSPQEGGARRECRPVHALVLPVYHPLRRLPLRRVLYLDPGHSYTESESQLHKRYSYSHSYTGTERGGGRGRPKGGGAGKRGRSRARSPEAGGARARRTKTNGTVEGIAAAIGLKITREAEQEPYRRPNLGRAVGGSGELDKAVRKGGGERRVLSAPLPLSAQEGP